MTQGLNCQFSISALIRLYNHVTKSRYTKLWFGLTAANPNFAADEKEDHENNVKNELCQKPNLKLKSASAMKAANASY